MHVRILTAVCALTAAAAAVAAPDASGSRGLVAHWTFDEGTGDVLHDRSGNGNHGQVHGASWVDSGAGWALRFDGANDYVDCGSGASLDLTGPVTLQAWLMPTAANRGEPGIAGTISGQSQFVPVGPPGGAVGDNGAEDTCGLPRVQDIASQMCSPSLRRKRTRAAAA